MFYCLANPTADVLIRTGSKGGSQVTLKEHEAKVEESFISLLIPIAGVVSPIHDL